VPVKTAQTFPKGFRLGDSAKPAVLTEKKSSQTKTHVYLRRIGLGQIICTKWFPVLNAFCFFPHFNFTVPQRRLNWLPIIFLCMLKHL